MMRILFLLLIVAVSACQPDKPASKGVIYDSLAPLRDSLEAAMNAKDTVRVSYINSFNNECEVVSDSMQFRWPIHIAKNELGFVRVRSDASCFEVDSCFHNLIGTIPHDQWVWSYGTVKYKYWSSGLAWVICIRDSKGRLVKGYISETVVDRD
jgi:hypothetical protein